MHGRVVIVGASVAGAHTAEALRAVGHTGPITLVGAESELPYDKPPLSKQFLAGEWGEERITLLTSDQAAGADIELRLGVPATRLHPDERRITLADDTQIAYELLVIATGAGARPSPWPAESGVHLLRTLQDSRGLRAAINRGGHMVVVGGGFIGSEVAATAATADHGRTVTVVDPLPAPAERAVGPEIGALLAHVHARHGVSTRLGTGVEHVAGHQGALTVTLAGGEQLSADSVVVGIGVIPNTDWLAGSGLHLDDGVVCDAHCRAIGHRDIYAVGDVARWHHAGHDEPTRVEHWTNATDQAACVAHNITHPDEPREHRPTEYVWSDQYDWRIQIAGRPGRCAHREIIGDADGDLPRFVALFEDDRGAIGGAVAVNWPRALIMGRRQIDAGTPYGEARDAVAAVKLPLSRPA